MKEVQRGPVTSQIHPGTRLQSQDSHAARQPRQGSSLTPLLTGNVGWKEARQITRGRAHLLRAKGATPSLRSKARPVTLEVGTRSHTVARFQKAVA